MAAFDPNIPNVEMPDWMGVSKGISQPAANESFKYLASGIGQAVEHGAKLADSMAEKYVEDKSRTGSEAILNQEIGTLESLLPNKGAEVPSAVTGAERRAQLLESARANGKIPQTLYKSTLDNYATSLRTQYPEYKDAVDKGIARGTGVSHTANDRYQALMGDLNSLLTNKQNEVDKIANKILEHIDEKGDPSHNIPGGADMYNDVKSGKKTPAEGAYWLEDRLGLYRDIHRQDLIMANRKGLRADIQAETKSDSIKIANTEVTNFMTGVMQGPLGIKSPDDLVATIQGMQNGTIPYNAKQMQQLGESLAQNEPMLERRLYQLFNQPVTDATGKPISGARTRMQRLEDEGPKVIDAAMKQFKAHVTWLKDGQVGPLASAVNAEKAILSNTKLQILNDTKVGSHFAIMNAVKELAPQDMVDLTKTLMGTGFPSDLGAMVTSMNAKSHLPDEDLRRINVKPSSMAEDIKDVKTVTKDPRVFSAFVDDVKSLYSPNTTDAQKAAKVKYLYGPENVNVINTWDHQNLDPTTGRPSTKKNQWDIYGALYSKQATDEIKRLDARYHGTWDMYKSSASMTFAKIAQKDLLDLNQYEPTNKDHITYNPRINRFVYDVRTTGPQDLTRPAEIVRPNLFVQRSIDNINKGLSNFDNIVKAEGRDESATSAFMFKLLQTYGYDAGNSTAFPKAMVDALKAPKEQERKETEAIFSKKKKEQ